MNVNILTFLELTLYSLGSTSHSFPLELTYTPSKRPLPELTSSSHVLLPPWCLCESCQPTHDQANKVHRKLLRLQPRNIGIGFQALLNEGIYPWSLNLFNSWLLALSLEGLTKNKKHQETQRRENPKKKLVWAWSSHYPWVFFLFLFDHGFNAIKTGPLLTKASEPLSNAIGIAGTIIFNGVAWWVPTEVGYKNRWFKARIRKFRGKTVPGFRWFVCWTKKMSLFTQFALSRCWGIKAMIQDSNLPPPFTKYFNVGYDVT